jgi:rhamnosyltransferase
MIVSVIVRCRNAASDLRKCLAVLRGQVLGACTRLEIIVVDNESTDHTPLVAKEVGAIVVQIAVSDFSWGRALNRGIQASSGEILILLSSDACPTDTGWVMRMLAPFCDTNVAAVYGRQLPWPNAPIDERARLLRMFPEVSQVFRQDAASFPPTGRGLIVSNACGAIRRCLWDLQPYDETVAGGEEGVWTAAMVNQGFSCVYNSKACVWHSHRESITRFAWREWELFEKNVLLVNQRPSVRRAIKMSASLCKRRIVNCLNTEASRSVKAIGMLRLPFEVGCFMIICVLSIGSFPRAGMRRLFWR